MTRKDYTAKDFDWTQWTAEQIEALVPVILARKKKRYDAVKAVPDATRNFENTVYAIESSNNDISSHVSFMAMLLRVSPDASVREAAHQAIQQIEQAMIDIEYDEELYKAVKTVEAKGEHYKGEDAKLFSDMLRLYRRTGFELPLKIREQLKMNFKRLAELALEFEVNIDKWQDAIWVTKEELDGLSERYINQLQQNAEGKYRVSLETPDYMPFMQQAKSGSLRKVLMDKYFQKGGERNMEILKEVLDLRYKNARLLGYEDHAEFATEIRMAKKPQAVRQFLKDLRDKTKPLVEKEIAELTALKKRLTGDETAKFEYYDYFYLIEQWKKERFNIDTETIREYFPFSVVKQGMFGIYEKLFSVVFTRVHDYPVWHEDVEVYRVNNTDGVLVGYFMLDLYPRTNKYGHACMVPLVSGHETSYRGDVYSTPLAGMITNFPKPTKDNPSLLSIDEVETFFHEFGHVIHGVLTGARYESQSGTSVARDFVEAPSQMLEYWVWNKETLSLLSGHYADNSRKLPDDMLDNLLAAKYHAFACWTTRQLVFGFLDFAIHTGKFERDMNTVYNDLMKEFFGFTLPVENRFAAGFGHLMGYDAGYYGYMWSLVFAADMFTRFEKEGLLNQKTGMEYRQWILEKGSSMDEMELVRGFLGREPNNEAFLKELCRPS